MIKRKPLAALSDLATRAGRWLGLAAPPALPTPHTNAVKNDRFDEFAWRDTWDQAAELQKLAYDLADVHDYTSDLLCDVWTGAYKAAPELHERHEMDRSRLLNHQVVSALLNTADFAALREHTVGDPYAAAMAVLAQRSTLRGMLDETRDAQKAAQAAAEAQQQAEQAACAVQAALEAAGAAADEDGRVPENAEEQVMAAIAAAEAADQAAQQAEQDVQEELADAAPRIHAAARAAAAQAAQQAQEEAALMAAWGVQPGILQQMSFEERRQLAQRLAGGRLAEFASLIGRIRAMAKGERARRVRGAPGELIGITLGDDLSRLVPSELVSLAVPGLRADFAARLAEGRLMTYETHGEDSVGAGAIIACVDCSSSMTSTDGTGITREAWAKAVALALLDQARASRRTFVGVLFSSAAQVKVFRFPGGRADIRQVIEFAEHFFAGGTDFQAPLDAAADVLQEQHDSAGTRHGDIVLITDGSCNVTDEWLQAWNKRKAVLGHRVFGVTVTSRPGPVMDKLCDSVRTVTDLADLGASADMFRLI